MDRNLTDTIQFKTERKLDTVEEIIGTVYMALREKGYDPINQIVGYIISGDPTYITSHNNARYLIRRLERDEILEELVGYYVRHIDEEMERSDA